MKKWMKDGLIGWAASALFVFYVFSNLAGFTSILSLIVSLFFGPIGGILLGQKHDGWIWSALGGSIAAALVVSGYILFIAKTF